MKLYRKENKIFILLCLFAYSCSNPVVNNIPINNSDINSNTPIRKNITFTKITPEESDSLSNYMRAGIPNAYPVFNQPYPTSTPVLTMPSSLASGANYNQSSDYGIPSAIPSPTAYPTYQPIPYPTYTPTPYPIGTYFGGTGTNNFDEYILYEFEKAKIEGYKGSYLSIVNEIVNPIISGLADDARLISASGNTDKTGLTQNNPSPDTTPTPDLMINNDGTTSYVTQIKTYNWQFTYSSSLKKEVYSILVNSNETLILRQKWKLRGYDINEIKIDSSKAIEITEQAIKNKNFPSPIEYSSYDATYLYEIPEKAYISYNLGETENHDLVWNITISKPEYNTAYDYSEAYSTVNAKTGELIRLTRMAKVLRRQDPNNPYLFVTPSPDHFNYKNPTPI